MFSARPMRRHKPTCTFSLVLVVSIACVLGSAPGTDRDGEQMDDKVAPQCEEGVTELRLNATVHCKISAEGMLRV